MYKGNKLSLPLHYGNLPSHIIHPFKTYLPWQQQTQSLTTTKVWLTSIPKYEFTYISDNHFNNITMLAQHKYLTITCKKMWSQFLALSYILCSKPSNAMIAKIMSDVKWEQNPLVLRAKNGLLCCPYRKDMCIPCVAWRNWQWPWKTSMPLYNSQADIWSKSKMIHKYQLLDCDIPKPKCSKSLNNFNSWHPRAEITFCTSVIWNVLQKKKIII